MIDPEEYTYKEPDESSTDFGEPDQVDLNEEQVENINSKEILSEEKLIKDPKFFYFIDSEGNVCRKARISKKRKFVRKQIINYFDKVNLTVPKIMVDGYVSKKFKTVRRTGPNGGMIWVPADLVGKTFQVILIPKDDWVVSQIK